VNESMLNRFSLDGRVIAITGGAGLLGRKHAEAVLEAGGLAVLLDIDQVGLDVAIRQLEVDHSGKSLGLVCNITDKPAIQTCLATILQKFGRLDGLVNNAANDPKVGSGSDAKRLTRFENMSLDYWNSDIAVGLTGAFQCSQVFGYHLAMNGGGVILNVASDLAVISPDQRIYRQPGLPNDSQPVKPVTYSVVKAGLIGLTRYLATYWAEQEVRVNAVSPGGVFSGQDEDFVEKLTNLIPMGRMANKDEYKATIVYLLSDASSYVTGLNLMADGGRTCW
jgi:NAD(P)-dependent dehydrogenase (short-subunit alcohol dehydrogenase family)